MKKPFLRELNDFCKKCSENYKESRVTFFFRPNNQDRLNDIAFIKNVAEKFQNRELSNFLSKGSKVNLNEFQRNVLSGVLIIELHKITKEYRDERSAKRSALANLILDFFEVDTLSKIPDDYLSKCMTSLQHFNSKINELSQEKPKKSIQWHQSMKNEELQAFILNNSNELLETRKESAAEEEKKESSGPEEVVQQQKI